MTLVKSFGILVKAPGGGGGIADIADIAGIGKPEAEGAGDTHHRVIGVIGSSGDRKAMRRASFKPTPIWVDLG